MNKSWFYLGSIGILSLVMTSCGDGGSKPAVTPGASPTAVASPAASPVAAVPPASTTPAPSTVPAIAPTTPAATTSATIKPKSVDVTAGLIAPTDADNWTKTVSKGRSDPFATLALQATEVANATDPSASIAQTQKPSTKVAKANSTDIKSGFNKSLPKIKVGTQVAAIEPAGEGNTNISKIPRSGVDRPLPKIAVAIKPGMGTNSATGARKPAIANTPATNQKPVIALRPVLQPFKPGNNSTTTPNVAPTAAEPTLARTVGISGVIEVAGKTQVIVRLPNESFSRYVEIGDRIYDGKIKVKRVEGEQTLSPIVILEESGVEVSRKVGELATTALKENTAK